MTYTNQKNESPVQSKLANPKARVEFSVDDIGRSNLFDAGFFWIIPFDCFETLPRSRYEISYDVLALTNNPLTRRIFSSCDIYVHTYWQPEHKIWEGAPTAITGGQSGNFDKVKVSYPYTNLVLQMTQERFDYVVANMDAGINPDHLGALFGNHYYSPSHFLGLPLCASSYTNVPSLSTDFILGTSRGAVSGVDATTFSGFRFSPASFKSFSYNALPLGLYHQICLNNYVNRNLFIGNNWVFPENERHMCWSSSLDTTKPVVSLQYDDDAAHLAFHVGSGLANNLHIAHSISLDTLYVRSFEGDIFNTGLPFPELTRGDIPSIEFSSGTVSGLSGEGLVYGVSTDGNRVVAYPRDTTDMSVSSAPIGRDPTYGSAVSLKEESPLSVEVSVSGQFQVSSSVTMTQLRTLEVLTAMKERAARTDGTYREYMYAMYGSYPNYADCKPRYVGGFKQAIAWSEVVQQSESSDSNPLGTTASRGVSAGNGYVGTLESDDFGYCMSVLMIVPRHYYTQGVERMWTKLTRDDKWFPMSKDLSPTPILNKELYVSGDSSVDDNLFAWQERGYEYKYRKSILTGRMSEVADSNNEEYSAYAMKRHFASTPQLNYGFVAGLPSNVDYSVFSNTIDTPFIISTSGHIKATQPIPAIVVPDEQV